MNIVIRTVTKKIGNPPASLERERAGLSGKDADNAKTGGQHRQYVECGFYKESWTKNTDISYFLFLRDGLFQGVTHHEILLYVLVGDRKR
ncbi:MAG: hypothetical protein ACE5HY_01430 [Candidatus Hydrothermarchaeales archaeon]